jgi:hypothetical protein
MSRTSTTSAPKKPSPRRSKSPAAEKPIPFKLAPAEPLFSMTIGAFAASNGFELDDGERLSWCSLAYLASMAADDSMDLAFAPVTMADRKKARLLLGAVVRFGQEAIARLDAEIGGAA